MTASLAASLLRLPDLKEIRWVMCPSCLHEWTNLRRCQVFEKGRPPLSTNLCVRCAEGVGAFPWIQEKWPWREPVAINTKRIGFHGFKAEELSPTAFRTFIDWKEKSFSITCRIGGYPIAVTYSGATDHFDNAVSAWFHIRTKLSEKTPQAAKADW